MPMDRKRTRLCKVYLRYVLQDELAKVQRGRWSLSALQWEEKWMMGRGDGAGEEGVESKKLVGNLLSAEITGRETRLNLLLIAAQPNWQGDHFWASSLADKRTINYQQGDGNSLHLGTWLTKILHNLTLGTNQLELGTALHLGTNIVLLN